MSTCENFLLCCDGLTRPIEPNPADVRSIVPDVQPSIVSDFRPSGCSTPCRSQSDPADVPCRAAGLDLQSRPIEYKDFQSAKAMN